jgi:hypothetical protein
LPPALKPEDPIFEQVAAMAGAMVVCVGYCEADGDLRYNAAVSLCGDGVLGRHRKVHLPAAESTVYAPGDGFATFDTPVGRVGMLIDYDKTFPESARTLALDGAQIVACLSPGRPASPTGPRNSPRTASPALRPVRLRPRRGEPDRRRQLQPDRRRRRPALPRPGQGRRPGRQHPGPHLGQAGLAVAELDVAAEIATARRVLSHLDELRPATYRTGS